ncbi:centrosome-associated protein CEP250 [Hippocampus zosterae]|uniref:centrosome-associated protein CEP250 n=1 Tax=Hippocampus zosterae TaxID=109293 RepID=UPI00223DD63E|nr:centrosome-associated protein CEP250 [Hippocampus zosterae]
MSNSNQSPDSRKEVNWKIRRLVQKQDEFKKLWQSDRLSHDNKVEALESQNRALQEKLDAASKEEEELMTQVRVHKAQIFSLEQRKCLIQSEAKDLKVVQGQLEGKIGELEAALVTWEKNLEAQAQKHSEQLQKVEDEWKEKMREKDEAFAKQAAALHAQMDKMSKQAEELAEDKRKLQVALSERQEELEAQKGIRDKLQYDHGVEMRLIQMQKNALSNKVTALTNTTDDLMEKKEALKKSDEQKSKELKAKNADISDLQTHKEIVNAQLQREERGAATLRESLRHMETDMEALRVEYTIEQAAHKVTKKDLALAKMQANDLAEKIKFHEGRVKAHQASVKNLECVLLTKDTYIRRFREDLETSISLINRPKTFTKAITSLKRKYITGDLDVCVDTIEEKIAKFLESNKLQSDHFEKTTQSLRRQLEQKDTETQKRLQKLDRCRGELIKIINEQRLEIAKVKAELNDVTHQLRQMAPPLASARTNRP